MFTSDFPGDLISLLCVGCWVVPFLAIGIPYAIWRSVRRSLQTHGVGEDGLYCANCRFDVRGGTTWVCPECGHQLRQWISPGLPRGGIIIKDLNPPISSGMAILFYVIAGFAPAVMAVLILGMLLPINYTRGEFVYLHLPPSTQTMNLPWISVNLTAHAERSWTGSREFNELTCWELSSHVQQQFNLADPQDRDKAALVWDDLTKQYPEFQTEPEAVAVREEFVDLLLSIRAFDRPSAEKRASLFDIEWSSETYVDFHPVYNVLCVTAVFVVVVLLIVWALRDREKAVRQYHARVEQVMNRYAKVVEENVERMKPTNRG